jgi:acetyltransferase-like isoleucine patch superfamily enzyme
VRLARFCVIAATVGVELGDGVSSSDGVAVIDTWGPYEGLSGSTATPPPGAPVVIDDGAHLGALSIIGPGVHIGAGAFVGEGAVVLDDVPAHAVVYGNPARIIRQWDASKATWDGVRFP